MAWGLNAFIPCVEKSEKVGFHGIVGVGEVAGTSLRKIRRTVENVQTLGRFCEKPSKTVSLWASSLNRVCPKFYKPRIWTIFRVGEVAGTSLREMRKTDGKMARLWRAIGDF